MPLENFEISEFEKDRVAREKEGLKKIKEHIKEDLAFFRSQRMYKSLPEAAVVQALREEYVKRVAGAETIFPLKKLLIFNTWYPPKGE